jgi:hypothetical protein
MNLAELARKYRTDKVRDPENPLSHDYIPTYEAILAGKDIRRILEIGIGYDHLFHNEQKAGASLRMWAECFPEAEVYGLDIRQDTLINDGRLKSFWCDQSDEASLRAVAAKIGGAFDLIVDDGSHIPGDQSLTATVFLPLLAPGGVYVIEDVEIGPKQGMLILR